MSLTPSRAEQILQDRRTVIAVAIFAALLGVATNLPWQLDDFDQAQQAFTSYEMITEGHWLYQRTPHELIAQKPPLVGWASAGIFALTRSWNVAWRLPSLIGAAVLGYAVFRAATTTYGRVPGLVALGAFSFNLLTVRIASLVRTDMLLALGIFLAGLLVFEHIRLQKEWSTRDRWLFCALLTACMWIKGPFLYVFILPALLVFYLRWRSHAVTSRWPGWWPWLLSLGLFLPWVIGGLRLFPTFYEQVIAFEVLNRFNTAVHRAQPAWFYVLHLLHKFAPWSVLAIALPFVQLRNQKQTVRRAFLSLSPATFWLVAWSLCGLLIMSIVPSKRVDRIYSVIPALCLLVAAQVASIRKVSSLRAAVDRWLLVCLVVAMTFTTAYAGFKIGVGYTDHADALVTFSSQVKAVTASRGWRFEVISGMGGSEGMLLYLEKPHFIDPEDAVRAWNAGGCQALVVPRDQSDELLPQLDNAARSGIQSVHRHRQPNVDYELIVRRSLLPDAG